MQPADVTVAATVDAVDQPTDGASIIVDRVELSEGGFVTVHDSTLADGAVFESIRGTSDCLGASVHENVRIHLDEPLESDEDVFSMAHQDTNENQAYDFPATEGAEDGPYVAAGGPVMTASEIDATSDQQGESKTVETLTKPAMRHRIRGCCCCNRSPRSGVYCRPT